MSFDYTDAACRDVDPELFFPVQSPTDDLRPEDVAPARAVCGTCPVRSACLAAALDAREGFGIWAGTTPNQRRALARAVA